MPRSEIPTRRPSFSEQEALDVIGFASHYYDEIKTGLPRQITDLEPKEES